MERIIVALGSNSKQVENIQKAQTGLRTALNGHIRFTESLWTEPVGIDSDRFLNCLGAAETDRSRTEVVDLLKKIEGVCGDKPELRRHNIITVDIDLLQYGDTKLKPSDWNRDYVKTLVSELQL